MLVNRNILVNGRRTSARLEPAMWSALSDICRRERTTISELCSALDTCTTEDNSLTALIRVFVMSYFRAAATEKGHQSAGHDSIYRRDPVSKLMRYVLNSSTDPSGPPPPRLSVLELNRLLSILDEENASKLKVALIALDQYPRG